MENIKKCSIFVVVWLCQCGDIVNVKFVICDGKILRRRDLAILEKVLISLIWGFQRTTGKFFGSVEWVSEQLGTSEDKIWKALERLEAKGLIRKEGDEWYISEEIYED